MTKYTSKNLIVENTYADGALGKIFGPVKDSMGKFGEILKDSAKLIGGDVGYLVKLTFSRLKSLEDIKSMRDKEKSRRTALIEKIGANRDALMDSWPDGKITSMMIAPGLFFTSSTLSGIDKITSPQFRAELGEYGFDGIPVLGALITGDDKRQGSLFGDIGRCDPDDTECYDRALNKYTKKLTAPDEKEDGVLSKLALKINKIFLFSSHNRGNSLIQEGEEQEELSAAAEKLLNERIANMINEFLKDEVKEFISLQDEYFEKITDEAANVIQLNVSLAATKESSEFFKTLETMKKLGGENMQGLDIAKIKEGFKKMGQKMKEDSDTMNKIQEEFEDNKVEPTEKELNKRLESLILDSFKSQFLQTMKGELEDYYEEVTTIITGGMSSEQQSEVSKDPLGASYIKIMKEHENKLKEALSKLKQS